MKGLTGSAESSTSLNQIIHRLAQQKISVAIADVESEPFPYADESFDVVLASEIIEHLHFNPFRLLKESFRVLKPKGRVVLSTPNLARLENLLAIFKGRSIHSDLRRRFEFPQKISSPGFIRLVIQTDQSRSPAGLIPMSTDSRELGLAIKGMAVS